MTIDCLSDLHVDFYFSGKPKPESVERVYTDILTDHHKKETGDVLIVAGDIGHENKQSIQVLEMIKELFGYKCIVCVLGNHDYYLTNEESRVSYRHKSTLRAEEMRSLINQREGMYCLDGNIIEIEGIRIGGCDSWYDGEYTQSHFDNSIDIQALWKRTMNDARYIKGMNWQEFSKEEKEKIEKIYKDVDILVTHINPSIQKEHTDVFYREEETTGFFTFDGLKYLKEGSMRYWIFGHTHVQAEFDIHGVKCIASQMGYPRESRAGAWKIKSFEV